MKDIAVSALTSWITCSKRRQPPCCKDIQAALWRGPCGWKRSPPANSQDQFPYLSSLPPLWHPPITSLHYSANRIMSTLLKTFKVFHCSEDKNQYCKYPCLSLSLILHCSLPKRCAPATLTNLHTLMFPLPVILPILFFTFAWLNFLIL